MYKRINAYLFIEPLRAFRRARDGEARGDAVGSGFGGLNLGGGDGLMQGSKRAIPRRRHKQQQQRS